MFSWLHSINSTIKKKKNYAYFPFNDFRQIIGRVWFNYNMTWPTVGLVIMIYLNLLILYLHILLMINMSNFLVSVLIW